MALVRIVPATVDHIAGLELRAEDAAEVAAFGVTPDGALRDSIARSLWAETYLVDGDGIVRLHYRRAINERDVTESILPLLRGAK